MNRTGLRMSNLGTLKRYLPPAVVAVIAVAVLVNWLLGKAQSDEDKIRASVQGIVAAARTRSPNAFLGYISKDFHSRNARNFDRLERYVKALWWRYRKVRIELSDVAITVGPGERPTSATVDFTAKVLLGTEPGQPATDELVQRVRGSDRYRLFFRKETDGVWRVVASERPAETRKPR